MQENEDSLEDWAESLTELSTMKTDLSQYIMADDVLLLQEQVEHLHCQWEELCLKVSLEVLRLALRAETDFSFSGCFLSIKPHHASSSSPAGLNVTTPDWKRVKFIQHFTKLSEVTHLI